MSDRHERLQKQRQRMQFMVDNAEPPPMQTPEEIARENAALAILADPDLMADAAVQCDDEHAFERLFRAIGHTHSNYELRAALETLADRYAPDYLAQRRESA